MLGGIYLDNMMSNTNIAAVNTMDLCSGANATFVTYDGAHSSMIDHILIGKEQMDIIRSCDIIDDEDVLVVSRHRPIVCTLGLPYMSQDSDTNVNIPRTNWNKAKPEHIYHYEQSVSVALAGNTELNAIAVSHENINSAYTDIVKTLNDCSDKYIPKSSFKHFLKPYWNQSLEELHRKQSELRIEWIRQGRPRDVNNVHYKRYKNAKRMFRKRHRQCVITYLQEQNEEIDRDC